MHAIWHQHHEYSQLSYFSWLWTPKTYSLEGSGLSTNIKLADHSSAGVLFILLLLLMSAMFAALTEILCEKVTSQSAWSFKVSLPLIPSHLWILQKEALLDISYILLDLLWLWYSTLICWWGVAHSGSLKMNHDWSRQLAHSWCVNYAFCSMLGTQQFHLRWDSARHTRFSLLT